MQPVRDCERYSNKAGLPANKQETENEDKDFDDEPARAPARRGEFGVGGGSGTTAVDPTSLNIAQNSSGNFYTEIVSLSGKVPSHANAAPTITFCVQWVIHNDGSIACTDSSGSINLEPGRNYAQQPLASALKGLVSVSVDAGAPCNQVYTIPETMYAPSGAGVDFGNDSITGATLTQVTNNVLVTVTCSAALAAYQGCGHGFWKNHPQFWVAGSNGTVSWSGTGYSTSETLGQVFTLGTTFSSLSDVTLMNALSDVPNGPKSNTLVGGAQILMQQAVAGLLNAGSSDINYYYEPSSAIVSAVNNALANAAATTDRNTLINLSQQLDGYNGAGCPYTQD